MTTALQQPRSGSELGTERLLGMYRKMAAIRAFEERVISSTLVR